MVKRGVNFIFIFAFVIFLLGFVSSAACSVQSTPCISSDNLVMRLSSATNAHGAVYDQGTYSSALCCDFAGRNDCFGGNAVLRLSSTTNAHAQTLSSSGYTESVCFGTLSCTSGPSCNPTYPIEMLSLSAQTNAHLGSFSTYTTKICCRSDVAPIAPICGDSINCACYGPNYQLESYTPAGSTRCV